MSDKAGRRRALSGVLAVCAIACLIAALLVAARGPWASDRGWGPSEMSSAPTEQDESPHDVQVVGSADPRDYRADDLGQPVSGMDGVDLSGISPGGGRGPEGHDWTVMRPSELTVPQVELVIPVVDRGILRDGTGRPSMDLPVSFQAAWLKESAKVAAARGTTVVAGHVNWSDGSWAPMSNLYNVTEGMTVYLTDRAGTLTTWRVTGTAEVPQAELSDHTPLTDTTGQRRLVLITCKAQQNADGSVRFANNWVVTAEPL